MPGAFILKLEILGGVHLKIRNFRGRLFKGGLNSRGRLFENFKNSGNRMYIKTKVHVL